jgi:hypothetical protein
MTETTQPPQWFDDLVTGCVLAALCPPLPVPFFEDWGRNLLRRRIVQKTLIDFNLCLDSSGVKRLAGEADEGCVRGCFWTLIKLLLFPWKMIRAIFYVVSVRRRLKETAYLIERFYLLRALLENGTIASGLDTTGIFRITRLIDATLVQSKTGFEALIVRSSYSYGRDWLRKTVRHVRAAMLALWRHRRTQKDAEQEVEVNAEQSKVRGLLPAGFVRSLWEKRDLLDAQIETFRSLYTGRGLP